MPLAAFSSSRRTRWTRPPKSRAAVRTSICRADTWKCVSLRLWGRRVLPLMSEEVRVALDQRFRLGHGRVVAALTRRFGVERLPLIENAVQDAYVRALERWPSAG